MRLALTGRPCEIGPDLTDDPLGIGPALPFRVSDGGDVSAHFDIGRVDLQWRNGAIRQRARTHQSEIALWIDLYDIAFGDLILAWLAAWIAGLENNRHLAVAADHMKVGQNDIVLQQRAGAQRVFYQDQHDRRRGLAKQGNILKAACAGYEFFLEPRAARFRAGEIRISRAVYAGEGSGRLLWRAGDGNFGVRKMRGLLRYRTAISGRGCNNKN